MARADDETARYKGYGTPYLTPSQELDESLNLGQRALEARVSANPLTSEPVLAGSAVPAAQVAAVPAPAPNPLTRPPVPLVAMGTDQRIAWQQLEDEQRVRQDAVESRKLEAEIRRQQLDHRAEQIRQNQELVTHIPKLREALNTSPEAYLDLKADLASRYAVGMGSPESDKIFEEFEKIYAKKEAVEGEINKARIARQEQKQIARENTLLKQAAPHGGDVERQVAVLLADPLKGASDASALLAQVEQRSIVQALRDQGLTDQEITQRYGTGQDFNYQAAKNAPKSAKALLLERKQARADFAAIDKARVESRFNPAHAAKTGKDPYVNTTWTPEREQEYQDASDLLTEVTPKIGDNRAGVQGMIGAREGESLYRGYARPAVTQVAAPAPAAATPPSVKEKTYRNPTTGKRIALRNGKWEEI